MQGHVSCLVEFPSSTACVSLYSFSFATWLPLLQLCMNKLTLVEMTKQALESIFWLPWDSQLLHHYAIKSPELEMSSLNLPTRTECVSPCCRSLNSSSTLKCRGTWPQPADGSLAGSAHMKAACCHARGSQATARAAAKWCHQQCCHWRVEWRNGPRPEDPQKPTLGASCRPPRWIRCPVACWFWNLKSNGCIICIGQETVLSRTCSNNTQMTVKQQTLANAHSKFTAYNIP